MIQQKAISRQCRDARQPRKCPVDRVNTCGGVDERLGPSTVCSREQKLLRLFAVQQAELLGLYAASDGEVLLALRT